MQMVPSCTWKTTCPLFACCIVLLLLGLARPAHAEEAPPALTVRLRDVHGTGISEVTVEVRDRSGTVVLERATTDATGTVQFARLPASELRISVAGRLPDGTPLLLPGQDRAGIALTLPGAPLILELRSEPDGLVRPDPASELTLEPGIVITGLTPFDPAAIPLAPPVAADREAPVAVVPTAPVMLQVPVTPSATAEAFSAASGEASAAAAPAIGPGILLLGLFLIGIAVVIVAQVRGRTQS